MRKTDKHYWHRFTPFYEKMLKELKNCNKILEYGIFNGDSIRWLNSLYPNAKIYGCDIIDKKNDWPQNDQIEYIRVDQDKIKSIKNVFEKAGTNFDLIIEDGSHYPQHQKNCLIESLKHIKPNGFYILEDLHTSHPNHNYYNSGKEKAKFKLFKKESVNYISALHLLLCIEHLKVNDLELSEIQLIDLSTNSLFSKEEVSLLYQKVASIEIFKRSTLPHYCYSCKTDNYDYHNLKCKCGTDLYANSDSMTAIIKIK